MGRVVLQVRVVLVGMACMSLGLAHRKSRAVAGRGSQELREFRVCLDVRSFLGGLVGRVDRASSSLKTRMLSIRCSRKRITEVLTLAARSLPLGDGAVARSLQDWDINVAGQLGNDVPGRGLKVGHCENPDANIQT